METEGFSNFMPFHRRIRIARKQTTRRGAQFRNRGSVRGVAGIVEQRYGAILLRKQQWNGKKMYPSMCVAGQAIDAESRFLASSDLTKIKRILEVWPTTGGC
jgi:hypothetical protein